MIGENKPMPNQPPQGPYNPGLGGRGLIPPKPLPTHPPQGTNNPGQGGHGLLPPKPPLNPPKK